MNLRRKNPDNEKSHVSNRHRQAERRAGLRTL